MRKIAGIACVAMVLSACSTGPQRPPDGPGSGTGADYVPMVQASTDGNATTGPTYDALVAKCQREADGLPFIKTYDHDPAIIVVTGAVAFAVGWNIGLATRPHGASFAYPAALATVPSLWAMSTLFSDWVYSPQRAVWHQKQETQVANCMARYGYTNLDPTVKVTYRRIMIGSVEVRATGRDTFTAEHLARSRNCAAPVATLINKGPGFEDHRVACTNGPDIGVHCEFGQCQVVSGFASR